MVQSVSDAVSRLLFKFNSNTRKLKFIVLRKDASLLLYSSMRSRYRDFNLVFISTKFVNLSFGQNVSVNVASHAQKAWYLERQNEWIMNKNSETLYF